MAGGHTTEKVEAVIKNSAKLWGYLEQIISVVSIIAGFGGMSHGHDGAKKSLVGWFEAHFTKEDEVKLIDMLDGLTEEQAEVLTNFFRFSFPVTKDAPIDFIINYQQTKFRQFVVNHTQGKKLLEHLVKLIESEPTLLKGYEKAYAYLEVMDIPFASGVQDTLAERMVKTRINLEKKEQRNRRSLARFFPTGFGK